MKGLWLWLSVVASLMFALAPSQGCNANNKSAFNKTTSGNGATSSSSGGMGGDCIFCGNGGSGGAALGTIAVTPATVTLDVKGGTVPTQQFTATYNGSDVTSMVSWVVERPDVASITKTGLLQPTGKVGGTTRVLALYNMTKGEANAVINVDVVVNSAGLTTSQQQQFDSPKGSDPSLAIIYPFDKTVMPLRVLSPELMWQGAGTGDIFRLRLKSKHITYTEYFTAPSGAHVVKQAAWENVQFSGTGPISDPLKLELARVASGTAYLPKTLELRIAQGIVFGSVYYWQLPDACGTGYNGKILRIKPSSETTDEFYPSQYCWGCHTVSRDGTRLLGTFEISGSNGFPMQVLDLTKNPVNLSSLTAAAGVAGVFAAFNEDGKKLAYSDNASSKGAQQSAVHIVDANTGQPILQNAMQQGCGEPAWSPDGTLLAGICGMQGGGWTFDSSDGDLVISTLNKAQNQVVGTKAIVLKGGGTGRPAYPTFSPDSKYIAFGRPTNGSRSTGDGTLWLTDLTGQNVVQLVKASNDDKSFNPVFAPKSAGGYTWIVYISKRNYGHKLVDADRQQLWMTAIEDPPMKGQDPSNPPFYVRGQLSCDKSENAYYALDPCKKDGDPCEHGIECCNKTCIYDEKLMKHVCKKPEGGSCIPTGSGTCTKDSDCCDFGNNVICLNGFCELKPPK
jgi:hypothetical protein